MLNYKTALSVLLCSVLISACQPKKTESSTADAEPSSSTAAAADILNLQGNTEKLSLKLPDCSGKNCPEFSVERLHSNQFVLDELIDQAILSNLEQMLSSVQDQLEAPASSPHSSADSTSTANKTPTTAQNTVDAASSSAAVEARISKTAAQHMSEQVQPYLDRFLALDQELKTLGANHQISLMISPRILNSEAPLATVVINSSSYLGGAHGASGQRYFNFDLKRQKQVPLKDVVLDQQYPKLQMLAYAAFKDWVSSSQLATNVAEYEQVWKFSMSENFYLGKQGLILQYGEYEIGPYVVGLPRLVIPYADLKGILKPAYFPAELQVDQPASAVVANNSSKPNAPAAKAP